MATEENPFEAVRAMMLENLEKVGTATQSYLDMVDTFKEYIERQVAANRDFGEKLLRAKDFQEAFRIQVEYFQTGAKMAGSGERIPEPTIE